MTDFYDEQVFKMFFPERKQELPPNQMAINLDRESQMNSDKEAFEYDENAPFDDYDNKPIPPPQYDPKSVAFTPEFIRYCDELGYGYESDYAKEEFKRANIPHQTDPVNPAHYQNVAAGLDYMELMVDLLAAKKGVESHLYGQIYKYLMRAGKKDSELQDIRKAQWYLNALVNYQEDGTIHP